MNKISTLNTSVNAGSQLTSMDRFYGNVGSVVKFEKTPQMRLQEMTDEMDQIMNEQLANTNEWLAQRQIQRELGEDLTGQDAFRDFNCFDSLDDDEEFDIEWYDDIHEKDIWE